LDEQVPVPRSKTVRIASSHLITSCATLAAIMLFVALGSQVVPGALGVAALPADSSLTVALLLNIAIILFGWRRSKDLKEALEAHEQAERLAHRNANTDATTGLANRRELLRTLAEAIEAKRPGALLLIDLDDFKKVNDLHGHIAGDQLLQEVARTLTKAAPQGSCCARIGGDEFAMLIPDTTPQQAERTAEAILERLRQPVYVGGAQVRATGSVGLSMLVALDKEEHALRQSDVALYAAKRAGRNCFAWFDERLDRELAERVKLEEDMRSGIQRREFVPFFQPLIDLSTRELVGFEALARWRSPTRGLIEPEGFLDVAERTGMIGPITLSVLEQALGEARGWPQHLKLAINVSPVQFRDATLAEQILKLVAAAGFPASRLEIEITEGSLLEDRSQVLNIINSLKNVGMSISLDDFGTGYVALAQVNSLPIDRIKIDKSFINTMVRSDKTTAIVSTIANLGHTLNVPITAEGIDSEQMRAELKGLGCSEAQGWLFGRAISADTLRAYLNMSPGGGRPLPSGFDAPAPAGARRAGKLL